MCLFIYSVDEETHMHARHTHTHTHACNTPRNMEALVLPSVDSTLSRTKAFIFLTYMSQMTQSFYISGAGHLISHY